MLHIECANGPNYPQRRIQPAIELAIEGEHAAGEPSHNEKKAVNRPVSRCIKTQNRRVVDTHSLLDRFVPLME